MLLVSTMMMMTMMTEMILMKKRRKQKDLEESREGTSVLLGLCVAISAFFQKNKNTGKLFFFFLLLNITSGVV